MRWSRVLLPLCLPLIAGSTLPCPARAGWEATGGALVAPAGPRTQPLLAIPDGTGGVFIVLGGSGLAVQHLGAGGDVVAGWPAEGVGVSTSLAPTGFPCSPPRFACVSATSDGAGGVFVTWGAAPILANTTFPTLYAQHITANGQLAAGWPVGGKAATTGAGQSSALAYPDGAGGVFVLWHDRRRLINDQDDPHIMLQHFLGNGARAVGFAALGRFLGSNLPPIPAPRIAAVFAADPGDGAWSVVTRASADTTQSPSGFVLMKIATTGQVAEDWGEDGIMLPGPSADVGHPDTRDVRVFPDGSGGAWTFIASGARGHAIAFHLFGDGTFDPALPAEGLTLAATPDQPVDPDGVGGFFAREAEELPPSQLDIEHLAPDGSVDPTWPGPVRITGPEDAQLFPTPDGVLGVGWVLIGSAPHCDVTGADLLVGRLKRDGSIPSDWPVAGGGVFGIAAATDVCPSTLEFASAACADGSGGYVVAWKLVALPPLETEARAMRYTLQGAVAGVGPGPPGALALRGARFTRAGIRVSVSGATAGDARLDVYDLLGRKLAATLVSASDLTVQGTRDLRSGLYFLRLRTASGEAHAKVLVAR